MTNSELPTYPKLEKYTIEQLKRADLLVRACMKNDLLQVQDLLDQGVDPSIPAGFTGDEWALLRAISVGNPSIVRLLLEHGAPPNIAEFSYYYDCGYSALALAVSRGSEEMVDLLLEHGADPEWDPKFKSSLGSPFQVAIQRNHLSLVKKFFNEEKRVNGRAFAVGAQKYNLIGDNNETIQAPDKGTNLLGYVLFNNTTAEVGDLKKMAAFMLAHQADPEGCFLEENEKGETLLVGGDMLRSLVPSCGHRMAHPVHPRNAVEIWRMLLDAGIDSDLSSNRGLLNELHRLKAKKSQVVCDEIEELFNYYDSMPKLTDEVLATLTKEELFRANEQGLCLMDTPSTWKQFARVEKALKDNGEPLTKDDFLKKNAKGQTWLERSAECFDLESALARFVRIGGTMREALLDSRGMQNAVFKAALEWQQEDVLINRKLWLSGDNTLQGFQQVYRLLPPEVKKEITDYHARCAELDAKFHGAGRRMKI